MRWHIDHRDARRTELARGNVGDRGRGGRGGGVWEDGRRRADASSWWACTTKSGHLVECDEDDAEDDAQKVPGEAAVKRVESLGLVVRTKAHPVGRQEEGNGVDGKEAKAP